MKIGVPEGYFSLKKFSAHQIIVRTHLLRKFLQYYAKQNIFCLGLRVSNT